MKMKMIHANRNEFMSAFKGHKTYLEASINKNSSPSYSDCLLFFYALECGLKSYFLYQNNLFSTQEAARVNHLKTHNLSFLIKANKLPAQVMGALGREYLFKLQRDGTKQEISDIHQAWRYHILIDAADEKEILRGLQALKIWLEENL